jgi:hypothetical protein
LKLTPSSSLTSVAIALAFAFRPLSIDFKTISSRLKYKKTPSMPNITKDIAQ